MCQAVPWNVWVKVCPQKKRNAKDDFQWQSGDWIEMANDVRKRWKNSDYQWYVRCEQPLLKNGKELIQRKGTSVKILLTLVTHSTFNTSFDYTNRSKVEWLPIPIFSLIAWIHPNRFVWKWKIMLLVANDDRHQRYLSQKYFRKST